VSAPKVRKYPRIAPKISSAMMLVRLIALSIFDFRFSNSAAPNR
jgi:hypothetical protein